MRRSAVASVVLALAAAAACGGGSAGPGASDASADHAVSRADAGADAGGLPIPAACGNGLPPPTDLACTGLYADYATKTVASEVQAYAPSVPEWTDGAVMQRWIYLPPGQAIDDADPNEWLFPVGTRAWMQISRGAVLVETRYFQKVGAGDWASGTYQWSADGSTATLFVGGQVTLPGDAGTYLIPSADECAECHAGRTDSLLGFEAVSLGLRGATGLTLEELVKQRLLSPVPATTRLTIGDDGTTLAGPALAWLHVNCGTACHNSNSNALAFGIGMVLRLDPTQLNGEPPTTYQAITTTVGVGTTSPSVPHQTRIVPGYPQGSVIFERIGERNAMQMPPVGTQVVDAVDTAAVGAWIAAMPKAPGFDAGVDAHPSDAAAHEGGAHDGSPHDGAPFDGARNDGAGSGSGSSGPQDGGVGDGGGMGDGSGG